MKAAGRPPLPHAGGGRNGPIANSSKYLPRGGREPATVYPGGAVGSHELGPGGDWDGGGGGGDDAGGGGDDASLAGLSLASGDSMQYSVDSG